MWLLLLCLPASEEMTKKKPYNCNILHSCIKYLGCFFIRTLPKSFPGGSFQTSDTLRRSRFWIAHSAMMIYRSQAKQNGLNLSNLYRNFKWMIAKKCSKSIWNTNQMQSIWRWGQESRLVRVGFEPFLIILLYFQLFYRQFLPFQWLFTSQHGSICLCQIVAALLMSSISINLKKTLMKRRKFECQINWELL